MVCWKELVIDFQQVYGIELDGTWLAQQQGWRFRWLIQGLAVQDTLTRAKLIEVFDT